MPQITLTLPDMHCDGCIRAITRVAQKQDAAATVTADLPARRVTLSGALDEPALRAALAKAGFPAG